MAFCSKIKAFTTIGLSIFLTSIFQIHAQEPSSYWQIDYAVGSILKHKKIMGHLVTAHPEVISVGWHNKASIDEEWKRGFNYPDWGFTLTHQKFNNTKLGNVTALTYTTTYYLRNRNKRHLFNLQLGLGLGYNSNPLNLETNNQNVAISTPIVYTQLIKFNYSYPNLLYGIGIQAGLFFTHYSNAAVKSPNFGINSVFLNAGLNYSPKFTRFTYPEKIKKEKLAQKDSWHLAFRFSFGMHEARAGLGTKSVYVLSAFTHKQLTKKSGVLGGIDFINSMAAKDYTVFKYHTQTENPDRTLSDHKQVGIYTGYELYFNKIIFGVSAGYYLYNPFHITPSIYERFTLKYKFSNNKMAITSNLKVHYFKAEFTSLGIEYQLF